MEALLFILDSAVLVAMVYWGLLDDRRPAGKGQASLFRFIDDPGVGAEARKARLRSRNAPKPKAAVPEAIVPRPLSPAALRRAEAVRRRMP